MCGIVGFVNLTGERASEAVLARMTQSLAHRGPDGEGVLVDGPVALGHRRLAILDLTPSGHQPMLTPDGRFAIVYNGETYNFRELRASLEEVGVQFCSRSDTEVVLSTLARSGEAALGAFNGMFAFALWDRQSRELLIARDRYGIKPLYYTHQGGALIFASEVKALLAHPAVRRGLDAEALLEYFTFQNFFTDRTLFDGVRILPPGSSLRVKLDEAAVGAPRRFWDFHFVEPEKPRPEAEYVEELDRLFEQAVRRQLVSDVDVGAYLSGGMDSGAITATAARQLPWLKSFTCGFDLHSASGMELAFDERSRAEWMSYLFKTEHYEVVLKAGDMERCFRRLAWHLEEPRVGQSYPNFYVAQLASRFVKVVLSGAGGDELFAGYPWRYYRAVSNDDFEQYVDKYYGFWQRLIPSDAIASVFAPIWKDVKGVSTRDIFRSVFQHHDAELTSPERYVNHSLYFEAKTFLHGLLVMEDKLSMAHGLETRVPFLDNDLVDFAQQVPVGLKLGNLREVVRMNENESGDKGAKYFRRTNDGKLVLRRAMSRHIPPELAQAEKQGFSAPDASWFRGDSIDYVRRVLWNPHARIYEFLDPVAVRALVADHLDGRVNRRLFIWSLLSFEQWLDAFLPS